MGALTMPEVQMYALARFRGSRRCSTSHVHAVFPSTGASADAKPMPLGQPGILMLSGAWPDAAAALKLAVLASSSAANRLATSTTGTRLPSALYGVAAATSDALIISPPTSCDASRVTWNSPSYSCAPNACWKRSRSKQTTPRMSLFSARGTPRATGTKPYALAWSANSLKFQPGTDTVSSPLSDARQLSAAAWNIASLLIVCSPSASFATVTTNSVLLSVAPGTSRVMPRRPSSSSVVLNPPISTSVHSFVLIAPETNRASPGTPSSS